MGSEDVYITGIDMIKFWEHSIAVACICKVLAAALHINQQEEAFIVGLLHDVLEDTLTTRETLAEKFGDEIVALVDGVTKIGRHEYVRKDEAQAETFRKLILASVKDIRVILIKLCDRLHNMRTLQHLSPEKQERSRHRWTK